MEVRDYISRQTHKKVLKVPNIRFFGQMHENILFTIFHFVLITSKYFPSFPAVLLVEVRHTGFVPNCDFMLKNYANPSSPHLNWNDFSQCVDVSHLN